MEPGLKHCARLRPFRPRRSLHPHCNHLLEQLLLDRKSDFYRCFIRT